MPVVWFIRHGQSESNADLRTSHPAESALTPRGYEEARQIAAAIPHPPDLFVVSPFLRARQTAVPTLSQFPHVPVETWPVYEFVYLDPAHYKNTTGSERWPLARAFWERNDPQFLSSPDAESFAALMERVTAVRAQCQARREAFIVVFSHGLFLRALLLTLILDRAEATPEFMARYAYFIQAVQMPNGAILQVDFPRDGRPVFSGFDTSHLVRQTAGPRE
ncbi:MAG: histidine phosphatase family protein [Ardenticatenaceae bacterium]|nr:histidine phosphatase family protein [Ardenticatenaceae bacterium]